MTDIVKPSAVAKPWWQSKTVWGGIIAAAGAVMPDVINAAAALGPPVAPVVSAIGHGVALLGAAYAVYGRFVATASLTG